MAQVVLVALAVATLYTAGTPQAVASIAHEGPLPTATPLLPTPTPRPRPRIGVIAGHWQFDSGAVCPDGLTEAQVNLDIATRVADALQAEGFQVDLLAEYDPNLTAYQALALISIHADTCDEEPERSAFKVAADPKTETRTRSQRLKACLVDRYQRITGLPYDPYTVTRDMADYHAFREIHYSTPAVIMEVGYLKGDRTLLTAHADRVAQGILAGLKCYIYNETLAPEVTTTP